MSVWSGVGGHMKLGVAGATVVAVAEWQTESSMRLAESTRSTSTGVERANILPDGTFQISLPWDDTVIPESVGLKPGAVGTVRLLIGASGKMYSFSGLVEKVGLVENVATDIIRCVVSGFAQGGIGDPIAAI